MLQRELVSADCRLTQSAEMAAWAVDQVPASRVYAHFCRLLLVIVHTSEPLGCTSCQTDHCARCGLAWLVAWLVIGDIYTVLHSWWAWCSYFACCSAGVLLDGFQVWCVIETFAANKSNSRLLNQHTSRPLLWSIACSLICLTGVTTRWHCCRISPAIYSISTSSREISDGCLCSFQQLVKCGFSSVWASASLVNASNKSNPAPKRSYKYWPHSSQTNKKKYITQFSFAILATNSETVVQFHAPFNLGSDQYMNQPHVHKAWQSITVKLRIVLQTLLLAVNSSEFGLAI